LHKLNLLFVVIGLIIAFQYVESSALENPGLKNSFIINVNDKKYQIETVSNFEIVDVTYVKSDNKIKFDISSGAKNSLAEILIPKELSKDGFSFNLDGQDFTPTIKSNNQIYFVTIQFNGTGTHVFEAKLNEEKSPTVDVIDSGSSDIVFVYIGVAIAIGAATTATVIYKSKKRK
jgi:hypothetical protein